MRQFLRRPHGKTFSGLEQEKPKALGPEGGEYQPMNYTDQTLKCRDCGSDFVWTASEQQFYAEKGFENSPQRCPSCRANRKSQMNTNRQMTKVTCAGCGKETEVPFVPRGDRPVYCSDCFRTQKAGH